MHQSAEPIGRNNTTNVWTVAGWGGEDGGLGCKEDPVWYGPKEETKERAAMVRQQDGCGRAKQCHSATYSI